MEDYEKEFMAYCLGAIDKRWAFAIWDDFETKDAEMKKDSFYKPEDYDDYLSDLLGEVDYMYDWMDSAGLGPQYELVGTEVHNSLVKAYRNSKNKDEFYINL